MKISEKNSRIVPEENGPQLEYLRDLGCEAIQGYR